MKEEDDWKNCTGKFTVRVRDALYGLYALYQRRPSKMKPRQGFENNQGRWPQETHQSNGKYQWGARRASEQTNSRKTLSRFGESAKKEFNENSDMRKHPWSSVNFSIIVLSHCWHLHCEIATFPCFLALIPGSVILLDKMPRVWESDPVVVLFKSPVSSEELDSSHLTAPPISFAGSVSRFFVLLSICSPSAPRSRFDRRGETSSGITLDCVANSSPKITCFVQESRM